MRHDDLTYAATVQPPGWLIAEPLDPAIAQQIAEFNLRGLRQLLAGSTAALQASAVPLQEARLASIPKELQPLWRGLDAPALQRLATMPFLLFEFGLESVPLFSRAPLPARSVSHQGAPLEFANQLLSYAWHLARANPLGAALSLGMPANSAAALREIAFGELQSRAAAADACMRLRWSERCSVWRPLIIAARTDDRDALAREQLAGLRRLAGELMSASAAGAAGRVAEPLW